MRLLPHLGHLFGFSVPRDSSHSNPQSLHLNVLVDGVMWSVPSIRIALPLIKASATFFLAESSTLWKVGCEICIFSAAFVCSNCSRSFSLMASNSSMFKFTFSKRASGTPRGLKYVIPGSQLIRRQILGRGIIMNKYSLYLSLAHDSHI